MYKCNAISLLGGYAQEDVGMEIHLAFKVSIKELSAFNIYDTVLTILSQCSSLNGVTVLAYVIYIETQML